MYKKYGNKIAVILLSLMLLVLGAAVVSAKPAVRSTAKANLNGGHGLEVEIAENGSRFIADETPVFDDGFPAAGTEFITQGYIYPAGTLTCENNACNGVLANGDPEFPDLMIGTWVCRGWFIGDGAHTTTGPIVATTQIYDFGDEPGRKSIVTDGFELADLETSLQRPVIGGTGRYRNVRGEQNQALLGFNGSMGVVLEVSFELIGTMRR
jgi:hypothetical protein